MTGERIDQLVESMDQFIESKDPPVDIRISWRTLRGMLRRARRISTQTMPALATGAQQAILIRDAMRSIIVDLPPNRVARIETALDHCAALINMLGTGGRSSSEPPPRDD